MLMRRYKWPGACFVLSAVALFATNGWSDNLSGQVNQNVTNQAPADQEVTPQNTSWPGSITKSLTLEPGSGQFSGDKLGFGSQVVITLYNPNPYAMRFDTTQRLGKEYSWVVPANSQRTVAFRYWNPFSDEVKFLSYQDPSSLVIAQGRVSQPVTEAAVGPPAPEAQAVTTPSPESTVPNKAAEEQPPMQTQSKSAVRGYW
jgi:hypothetical protein